MYKRKVEDFWVEKNIKIYILFTRDNLQTSLENTNLKVRVWK